MPPVEKKNGVIEQRAACMVLSGLYGCVGYCMIKSGAEKDLLESKGPGRPSGKGNFRFTFKLSKETS